MKIWLTTDDLTEIPFEDRKSLVGGKAAGLSVMEELGLRVPPFVVLPTTVWGDYRKDPAGTMQSIAQALPSIKAHFEAKLGYMPLLSVRSGARVSCPGMMDTLLNIGLDKSTKASWLEKLGKRCLMSTRCKQIEMFADVVDGIPRTLFDGLDLRGRVELYRQKTGRDFPDAEEQLFRAIEAVFKSWDNPRAIEYRIINNIPHDWGTAVVLQAMVFGNLDDNSCTGVLFTRNPSTGEKRVTGEVLFNAQGEDVVAGIRTPEPLSALHDKLPSVYAELLDAVHFLETHFRDMQDVEFTVQSGELFILQTRVGKRTARAAFRIAVEQVREHLISVDTALSRLTFSQWEAVNRPSVNPDREPDGVGLPASTGAVVGTVVFSKESAIDCNGPTVFLAEETSPDDLPVMNVVTGIVTKTGGATSHAAVVARSLDKVCVVGLSALEKKGSKWELNGKEIKEGDKLSVDGDTGRVWVGEVPEIPPGTDEFVATVEKVCARRAKKPIVLNPNEPPRPYLDKLVLKLGPEPYLSEEDVRAVLKDLDPFQVLIDPFPAVTEYDTAFIEVLGPVPCMGAEDIAKTARLMGFVVAEKPVEAVTLGEVVAGVLSK